jgi:hypothetical protein
MRTAWEYLARKEIKERDSKEQRAPFKNVAGNPKIGFTKLIFAQSEETEKYAPILKH